MRFLPISKEDMAERGWEQLDFLYISGDAYVDHPSFGHAIITRLLESEGYKVGIIAQPDWRSIDDFMTLGRPKYAVLLSSGVIDSMVNHYTASRKPRSGDLYSPGGKAGFRPDRAVIVYSNRVKEAFREIPVIIGGIEASLRRFAHYDYWDDKVRRSILQDSKADVLIYGMGEKPVLEIAALLRAGTPIENIRKVRGTAYLSGPEGLPDDIRKWVSDPGDIKGSHAGGDPNHRNNENEKVNISLIPSFAEVSSSKEKYAEAFALQYDAQDSFTGGILIQKHGERYLVQNPPAYPAGTPEMDRIYALPYERTYHPVYEKDGGIPAIQEVEFSITSHRGCYGGCSFCALNFHQGRIIQNRSQASILQEAKKLTWLPGFKGYIHDIGGPTANFRSPACRKQTREGACKGKQCLYPEPCRQLTVDHSEYLSLLRKLRELPEVKKVFIRSGIRYDYLMLDKNDDFFYELCEHHVSGQLKVAPEHVVDRVLDTMGKPKRKVYDRFVKKFYEINRKIGKEQYLVPYLISSHPGSDLKAAVELAEYLRDLGYTPEQVQDFYPTPGTLSACMFYTGLDPRNMEKVYVPKTPKEKAMQRALLQYRKKENYPLVREALQAAGREDLIGFGKNCLIRPPRPMEKRNGEKRTQGGEENKVARGGKNKGKGENRGVDAGKERGKDRNKERGHEKRNSEWTGRDKYPVNVKEPGKRKKPGNRQETGSNKERRKTNAIDKRKRFQ